MFKKMHCFFPFLYSVSLELLPVRSLKGTIFPGVLLQLHMLIFPSCGAWQWWLCPLRCSGLSGAPQRGRPSGHLRSSPRQTPMAELTPPPCPHTNTDIQAGKALPKSAGISLGGSNVGWLLMEGLWGSWCGGSTAATLPQHLWAWRFLLLRNGNVDAYDFPVLSKREVVPVTFRY